MTALAPPPGVLVPAPAVEEEPGNRPAVLTPAQFLLPGVAFVALLAVPGFLFVLPVLESHPAFDLPALLFAVATVYAAARLTGVMWAGRPQWATVGFWLFTYAWIAVAGLVQTLADADPLGVTLTADEQLRQALLVLLGMVCFDVAQHVVPGRPLGLARQRRRFLQSGRVLALGWVSVALAPVFVLLLGGPSVLFDSRLSLIVQLQASGLFTDTSMATGGLVFVLANCLPFVALLCLGRLFADDPAVRSRLSARGLLVLLVVANGLLNNPISNSRYWAFTVILGLLYQWRWAARPLVFSLFVTGFAVSSLTLFPFLDATRVDSQTLNALHLPGNSYDRPLDYLLTKTDYGSSTDVGLILRVGNDGLRWGEQLLGTVGFWVPRSLWPGKAENTYALIADTIGLPGWNLDSPLWAEGYVDFGWPGAALYLAAAGFAARRLDDAFQRARTRAGPPVPLAAVLVPAVAAYEFILFRGSLLQAMSRLVMMLALLLAVSVRRGAPEREPAGRAPAGVRNDHPGPQAWPRPRP